MQVCTFSRTNVRFEIRPIAIGVRGFGVEDGCSMFPISAAAHPLPSIQRPSLHFQMTRHSTSPSSSSDLEAHHSSTSYSRRLIDKSYKQHDSRHKRRKFDTDNDNSSDVGSRSESDSELSGGSSSGGEEEADSRPLARTGGGHAGDSNFDVGSSAI